MVKTVDLWLVLELFHGGNENLRSMCIDFLFELVQFNRCQGLPKSYLWHEGDMLLAGFSDGKIQKWDMILMHQNNKKYTDYTSLSH
ncbi:hypothetical protein L6452_13850 [Arctium lappa]|uniref:Uncharacterized protein n=1 Tax=Arctium lappa TaxID=4217 RepID=A0ACB9CJS2_ARCLA|nr:hypothetical protein L6452_13850 [Arctium lappa]